MKRNRTQIILIAIAAIFASLSQSPDVMAQRSPFRLGGQRGIQAGGGQGFRMGGNFGIRAGGGQGTTIGSQNFGMHFGAGRGAHFGGQNFGMQFGSGQGVQIGRLQNNPNYQPYNGYRVPTQAYPPQAYPQYGQVRQPAPRPNVARPNVTRPPANVAASNAQRTNQRNRIAATQFNRTNPAARATPRPNPSVNSSRPRNPFSIVTNRSTAPTPQPSPNPNRFANTNSYANQAYSNQAIPAVPVSPGMTRSSATQTKLQPPTDSQLIRVNFPSDAGNELNYTLNGTSFTVAPGNSFVMEGKNQWRVGYAPTPNSANTEVTLTEPGEYSFRKTEAGWKLESATGTNVASSEEEANPLVPSADSVLEDLNRPTEPAEPTTETEPVESADDLISILTADEVPTTGGSDQAGSQSAQEAAKTLEDK